MLVLDGSALLGLASTGNERLGLGLVDKTAALAVCLLDPRSLTLRADHSKPYCRNCRQRIARRFSLSMNKCRTSAVDQRPHNGALLPLARRTELSIGIKDLSMAERVGFEPTVRLPIRRISSAVLSTTQPPLRYEGHAGRRCRLGSDGRL